MHAFEFVNGLDSNQHIFQVITDHTKGTNTQFQFINNGLLKNQYCVFLTHENPNKIKKQMQKFGIDTDKFVENGLLHIHKIPNLLKHPDGSLAGFQEFFNHIMPNPRPRFRLVGRVIKDMSTEIGRKAEMEIEQFVHSFEKINGMILCCYEYEKLGNHKTMSYVINLLDCHDCAIFSTISEPNFAYSINNKSKNIDDA